VSAAKRDTDSPGVLVIPPLAYIVTLAVGLVAHLLRPVPVLPALPARILGVLLFLASAMISIPARRAMHRAGTNIRPDQPTLAIVTDGPFRYTRNPLYLSITILYIAISLLVNALWPLLLLVPLLVLMQEGVIKREERYLEVKFGEPYTSYKARVRRWL
jgi:protein-S-isoprenylcysteine O-methyltransferase Ste14